MSTLKFLRFPTALELALPTPVYVTVRRGGPKSIHAMKEIDDPNEQRGTLVPGREIKMVFSNEEPEYFKIKVKKRGGALIKRIVQLEAYESRQFKCGLRPLFGLVYLE